MSRDWYIVTPVLVCAVFALSAAAYWRAKRRWLAVSYWAIAAIQGAFGFEMHYGGRSWHDLILGPCSRTEYHRATGGSTTPNPVGSGEEGTDHGQE